jgi:hypothetical protein
MQKRALFRVQENFRAQYSADNTGGRNGRQQLFADVSSQRGE